MALTAIAQHHQVGSIAHREAVQSLGEYQGRGKGRTKFHHGYGNRAAQRRAIKARNVRRFRASSRGRSK